MYISEESLSGVPIKSPAIGGFFLFFISQCFVLCYPHGFGLFPLYSKCDSTVLFNAVMFLKDYFSFSVHMRDPNNQLHVIKNLKITVNNIVTQAPLQAAVRKLLNDVVSSCQPAESLVPNVITAGDYDLNISGKH